MSAKFLYLKVKNYLMDLIKQNANTHNYCLPSEKQLARRFNVSRITIQTAMRELQHEGLIERIQGKGTFIKTDTFINSDLNVSLYKICLCLQGTETHFVNRMIFGVKEFCEKNNTNCFIFVTYNDKLSETRIINSIPSIGFDGLIIYPVDGDYYNEKLIKMAMDKFPVVIIDRRLSDINLSYVASDHYKMTYEHVTKLIKNGHSHIAIIQPISRNISSVNDRIQGYINAHIDTGLIIYKHYILDFDDRFPRLLHFPISKDIVSSFKQSYIDFLNQYPEITAIIVASNSSFLAILSAIKSLNGKKSEDYTIVTYDDDLDDIKNIIDIPYETIVQDAYQIGYQSADLLYKHITQNIPPKTIIIPEKTDSDTNL